MYRTPSRTICARRSAGCAARLEEALRRDGQLPRVWRAPPRGAIESIDELISVFNKLLQIAEAESGMRTELVRAVDLQRIVHDMVELYDAAAEEARCAAARSATHGPVWAQGDRDLLASAVASLIDNAIKYAGRERASRWPHARTGSAAPSWCEDNGPGVPESELPRLTGALLSRRPRPHAAGQRSGPGDRFGHRDAARRRLQLTNAEPGLCASILLPRAPASQVEDASDTTLPSPSVPVVHLSNP